MDALIELNNFYEKITQYYKLVRDFINTPFPTNALLTSIQNLRTDLQRRYSQLESEITRYGGSSFMADSVFGNKQNVFDIAFDTIDPLNYLNNLKAINRAIQIVNKAIGKLEAERASWGVKGDNKRGKESQKPSKKTAETPKAFIAHGKGGGALLKLERFLRELGVIPIIVKDQPNADRTVNTKVQDCLNETDFVIIFATGDDVIKGKGEDKDIRQPRQNVIHEIGLAQKTHPGKIIYLLEERAEFPSNIKPKVYESFARQSMDDAFTAIVREMRNWGYIKVGKPEE